MGYYEVNLKNSVCNIISRAFQSMESINITSEWFMYILSFIFISFSIFLLFFFFISFFLCLYLFLYFLSFSLFLLLSLYFFFLSLSLFIYLILCISSSVSPSFPLLLSISLCLAYPILPSILGGLLNQGPHLPHQPTFNLFFFPFLQISPSRNFS